MRPRWGSGPRSGRNKQSRRLPSAARLRYLRYGSTTTHLADVLHFERPHHVALVPSKIACSVSKADRGRFRDRRRRRGRGRTVRKMEPTRVLKSLCSWARPGCVAGLPRTRRPIRRARGAARSSRSPPPPRQGPKTGPRSRKHNRVSLRTSHSSDTVDDVIGGRNRPLSGPPGPRVVFAPRTERSRRETRERKRERRGALTSSTNSADTGRWSLMVMVGWLSYDVCFTVTAPDAMYRTRSVQAGFRLSTEVGRARVPGFSA